MTKNDLKLSLSEKITFVSMLTNYFHAEIPVSEALSLVEQDCSNRKIKYLAHSLTSAISKGNSLYKALDKFHDTFGDIFMAIARAGEESGEIDKNWKRLLTILESEKQIRDKIIFAMIYPCILTIIGLIVIVIFLGWVFPSFAETITGNGGNLPASLVFLLAFRAFIFNNFILLGLAIIAAVVAFIYAMKQKACRDFVDKIAVKIPVLSNLIKYLNLMHFFAIFQVTYDAGIPIVHSLELATSSVKNSYIYGKFKQIPIKIEKGLTLAKTLKMTDIVPFDMIAIISSGENSGKLGQMLQTVSKTLEEKVDAAIKALVKLIEPILIVIFGIFVLYMLVVFVKSNLAMLNAIPM